MGGYVKRCRGLTAYVKIENPAAPGLPVRFRDPRQRAPGAVRRHDPASPASGLFPPWQGGANTLAREKGVEFTAREVFNGGAGMGSINNAAGFIKGNTLLGQGNTLTDQEAWD